MLPYTVTSTTVRVTIVVPSQEQVGAPWGRLHPLALAQTVFVPFPVKIPHVSHVQSRGERGGDRLEYGAYPAVNNDHGEHD